MLKHQDLDKKLSGNDMSLIQIGHKNRNFTLSFNPAPRVLEGVKKVLPVRKFNRTEKVWEVPELAVKTLDLLENKFKIEWTQIAKQRRGFINESIDKLVNCKFQTEGWEDFECEGPTLRMYQKHGVNFLTIAKKAILADDMGLGKTIQSIQAVLNLETKKNLIICPATLKWNWFYELKKHFNIQATIISGGAKKRLNMWNDIQEGFYIMSYDLLRNDIEKMPLKWDSIIADEAVYLKNPKAKRTQNSYKLKSDVKIALSGMPIETKLEDFYSIFRWIRPELSIVISDKYGKDLGAAGFEARYCDKDYFGSITNYKNLEELHTYTSPFILRREKKSVLTELPDRVYSDYPLELNDKSRKAYRAIAKETIQWLQENTGNVWQKKGALPRIQKLLQYVEFPDSVGFKDIENIKLEWLKDTYAELEGKMVVFVNYLDTVDLLRKEFKTKYIIKGDVDSKERVDLVEEFNNIDKGIFILTDAGRFGLNMTGASVLVNYGYDFNPASIEQREGRLHRIGQKNTVHVLNPFIKDTIDEKVMEVARKRLIDSQKFMENSDSVAWHLTNSEIEDMCCADY